MTLDFTKSPVALDAQDIAILPLALAKRLLKMYADSLVSASSDKIIFVHIDNLRKITTGNSDFPVMDAAKLSLEFYNERVLIENVCKENWDAYKVEVTACAEVPTLEGNVIVEQPVNVTIGLTKYLEDDKRSKVEKLHEGA